MGKDVKQMPNEPIFSITPEISNLLVDIGLRLGEIRAVRPEPVSPKLRRENRIRTIHSTLAIENNTLTLAQVAALLDGKRVLGHPVEIKEVTNAAQAYDLMFQLNPNSIDDLLKAHRILMNGLIKENGRFRDGNVGIYEGEAVVHIAPPAKFVPQLIGDLFSWYQNSPLTPLIKSAVFHYEFEFIHPFADGNGRLGRMWHTLLLGQWADVFYWLPIEELIKERQADYYRALGQRSRSLFFSGAFMVLTKIGENCIIPENSTIFCAR